MRKLIVALLLSVALTASALAACPGAGICFLGTQAVHFLPYYGVAPAQYSANSSFNRPAFAQNGSIYVTAYSTGNTAAFLPANGLLTPVFSAQAAVWVHFWYVGGLASTTANNVMVAILDSAGVVRVTLVGTGTNNQIAIATQNGGSLTSLATCSLPIALTTLSQYDLKLNYSTTGSAVLYQNAVAVCSFSGDTTGGSGLPGVEQVAFVGAPAANLDGGNWSEMAVTDWTVDARGLAVFDPQITASCPTQQWTGSTSSLSPSDTTDAAYIYTGTNDYFSLWSFASSSPSGAWKILEITETARAAVGTSGPQHLAYAVEPAGASSPSVSGSIAPTTSFSNLAPYAWTTNPTGSAWVPADISSSLCFGLESLP